MTVLGMRRGRGRPGWGNALSPAERETLRYLRSGLSNAEIASRRGVSVNTVRTQVSSMLEKLGLSGRKALARWEDRMTNAGGDGLRCSFCRKTSRDVEHLVAGRDAYICGECIDKCGEIIAEARAKAS
jgi:DNA-binding CsgD family transcriptional regulator